MSGDCECDDGMIVVPLRDDTDMAPCPVCESRFYWGRSEETVLHPSNTVREEDK